MNDILYENLAYEQTGRTFGEVYGSAGVPVEDNRPLFSKVTAGSPYTNVYSLATPQRVHSKLEFEGREAFRLRS